MADFQKLGRTPSQAGLSPQDKNRLAQTRKKRGPTGLAALPALANDPRQGGEAAPDSKVRRDPGLGLNQANAQEKSALPKQLQTSASALGQELGAFGNDKPSEKFIGKWEGFAKKANKAGVDIDSMVQAVLREAYLDTGEDLKFYAKKVQYFNNVKKAIREETKRARTFFTDFPEKGDEYRFFDPGRANLTPPQEAGEYYLPAEIATEFLGETEVEVFLDTENMAQLRSELEDENNKVVGDAFFNTETRVTSTSNDTTSTEQVTGSRWDPLVVDLDGDGIETQQVGFEKGFLVKESVSVDVDTDVQSRTERGNSGGVVTDELGTGAVFERTTTTTTTKTKTTTQQTRFTEWVGADDGLVVMDRDGDGQIQAKDLFGDQNVTGRAASDGFKDLAALDSNKDGVINNEDTDYGKLKVWQDKNSDGKVDEGELTSLESAGVSEIFTGSTDNDDEVVQKTGAFKSTRAVGLEETIAASTVNSVADMKAYLLNLEEKLASVGDDAQLANVDLQNILQKQQQSMQLMSNISKMLNDTAMAVIRKIQ